MPILSTPLQRNNSQAIAQLSLATVWSYFSRFFGRMREGQPWTNEP